MVKRPDLIDIVPQTRRGERGITSIIEKSNYDRWLALRGPALLAEGYTRLVVTAHVHYEDQQWKAATDGPQQAE